jgi:enolase
MRSSPICTRRWQRSTQLSGESWCKLFDTFLYVSDLESIEDPFAEDDWEAWSYFYKTSNFQVWHIKPFIMMTLADSV